MGFVYILFREFRRFPRVLSGGLILLIVVQLSKETQLLASRDHYQYEGDPLTDYEKAEMAMRIAQVHERAAIKREREKHQTSRDVYRCV
jgi:hypothetical protein